MLRATAALWNQGTILWGTRVSASCFGSKEAAFALTFPVLQTRATYRLYRLRFTGVRVCVAGIVGRLLGCCSRIERQERQTKSPISSLFKAPSSSRFIGQMPMRMWPCHCYYGRAREGERADCFSVMQTVERGLAQLKRFPSYALLGLGPSYQEHRSFM